jgi:hypothetical protein
MAKRWIPKFHIRLDGDELYLRASRRQFFLAVFLTVWMTGWSAGCALILTRFRWDMPLEDLIFPIPFFVGWILGAGWWITSLFSHENLRLDPTGVRYRFCLFWIPIQRRTLPLGELKDVDSFTEEESSADNKPKYTYGVEIRTNSVPLRFGQALDKDDRTEVVRVVGKHLKMLQSTRASSATRSDLTSESTTGDELFATSTTTSRYASSGALLLDAPPGTFERPVECCYRLNRTFEGVDFVWRGRFSLMGVLVVLALNLFWSTIVTVFALQLFEDFRLDLFLFLIPFELVGLAFFIGWLAVLFQPFFKERWRFTRGAIEHKFTVLWIGPTWRYDVIPLSHLELRRDEDSKKPFWERGKKEKEPETGASEGVVKKRRGKRAMPFAKVRRPINMKPSQYGRDFMLVFMATDGEPLCTIKHLNEGEARWIAAVVKSEFPSWFAR